MGLSIYLNYQTEWQIEFQKILWATPAVLDYSRLSYWSLTVHNLEFILIAFFLRRPLPLSNIDTRGDRLFAFHYAGILWSPRAETLAQAFELYLLMYSRIPPLNTPTPQPDRPHLFRLPLRSPVRAADKYHILYMIGKPVIGRVMRGGGGRRLVMGSGKRFGAGKYMCSGGGRHSKVWSRRMAQKSLG